MFAVMDADELTVARCLSDLDDELVTAGHPRVNNNHDRIARLIPKRNIETWILFLSSDENARRSVSEKDDYKDSKKNEQWDSLVQQAVAALYGWTRPGAILPGNLLDSLGNGLREISRALPIGR